MKNFMASGREGVHKTQKAQSLREKTDKFNYIKIDTLNVEEHAIIRYILKC